MPEAVRGLIVTDLIVNRLFNISQLGMRCIYAGLIFTLLCLFNSSAYAKSEGFTPVVFQDEGQKIIMPEFLYEWEPSHAVEHNDVVAGLYQENFSGYERETFMGQHDEIWMGFTLRNESSSNDFVFSLESTQFAEAELLYLDSDGLLRTQLTGLNYDYSSRPVDYHYFAFFLRLNPGEERTYYLRLSTPFKTHFTPILLDNLGFFKEMGASSGYGHVFVGLLLGAFVCLLVLSLSSSLDREVFYFGVFTLFAIMLLMYVNGFLMRYLMFTGKPTMALWLWLNIGLQVSYVMVNKYYFQLPEKYPRINQCLNVSLWITAVLFVMPLFVDYVTVVNLELVFVTLLIVGLTFMSCYIWHREKESVALFVIGNLGMLISAIWSTLAAQGLAADDWMSKHGYEVGFCWQVMFFTWALFQKNSLTREKENHLVTATLVAKAESKAKSDFIAKMSHEIRTPMNGVLGMAQLLRSTHITDEQKHYLDVIDSSGKTLLAVINDILDYSRLLAGKVELAHEYFDLQRLFAELNTLFGELAHSKSLSFNTVIPEAMPTSFTGDSTRLRQVLTNLLSNAFKFTDQGLVVLKVKRIAEEGKFSVLEFTVTDSGIGIDKKDQKSLFEDFTQSQISDVRNYGGSGLGLSICKQFVEMMGGKIVVYSERGKGAEFVFTVKLETSSPEPKREHAVIQNTKVVNSGQNNILVAEDNDVNRDVIEGFLKGLGYEADFVVNGEQALRKITDVANHYDLILMDCEMPLMDGVTVTRKVREWERERGRIKKEEVPIVALTAHASREYLKECLDSGMSGYICKPVMFSEFSTVVKSYLGAAAEEPIG